MHLAEIYIRILVTVASLGFCLNNMVAQRLAFDNKLCDSCAQELVLDFHANSFFKNNEYNNNFTKGFTGIGVFLEPSLGYYLTAKTKVNFGAYMMKFSGRDSFSQMIPTFTIQQKIGKRFDLVLGRIYGTVSHSLVEPLFRIDHYYQDHVEYGVQLLHQSKKYKFDLWLNWQEYIEQADPFQEQFELGYTSSYQLSVGDINLILPLQLLVTHKGGQIDTSTDPAVSLFNGTLGLSMQKKVKDDRHLNFEISYFLYQGLNLPIQGANSELFEDGNGVYALGKYQAKDFRVEMGYWTAKRFLAPNGEFLFHSISSFDKSFSQDHRKLLTTKIAKAFNFSDAARLELRADGYYDLDNRDLAYSFGLFFIIDERFLITKIRSK